MLRSNLKETATKLAPIEFIKTHRSYMVNINKIDSLNLKESIMTICETTIPISKRNRSIVIERLGKIL